VAAQFLTESTVLGSLGGLIGTSAGVATVVLVAIVGLLAGLYPTLRAAGAM
jgi:putative ABC transport system permease protein